MGPGLDPASEMGPLSSAEQLAVVERYVEIGLAEGATIACGGKRIAGEGFFYEPTVFVDVDNTMRISQEEIFGPVLVSDPLRFRGRGDPHRERYRLRPHGGGLDERPGQGQPVGVRAVRADTVFVNNTWACAPLGLPWGGYKQSGIGREIGDVGIEEFTELKAVIFAGASSQVPFGGAGTVETAASCGRDDEGRQVCLSSI